MKSYFSRKRSGHSTSSYDNNHYTSTGSVIDEQENMSWVKLYASQVPTVDRFGQSFPHFVFHREGKFKGLSFAGGEADQNGHLMRQVDIPPGSASHHLFSLNASTGDIRLSSDVRNFANRKDIAENTPVSFVRRARAMYACTY